MAGKKQLGQILLEAGIIDEFQLKSALGYQKQWGGRLGKVLVENRFLSEEALVEAINQQTGIPVVKLDGLEIPPQVIKMVPVDLAQRHNLVPIRVDGETGKPSETLVLAMSDPTNLNAQDEVQFRTSKRIQVMLATEGSIDRAIRQFYHGEKPEELSAPFDVDPSRVQFSGSDFAEEEMMLVQGTLEQGSLRAPAASPAGGDSFEDPFAALDSIASEPPAMPPPAPPVPAPPVAAPASSPSPEAAMPMPPVGSDPAILQEPEDDLPEVEIVEDFNEVEQASAPAPTPPPEKPVETPPPAGEPQEPYEPPGSQDVDVFGTSGDLLGPVESQLEDVDRLADAIAEDTLQAGDSGEAPGPSAQPKSETASPGSPGPGSKAMAELLSRVGIQARSSGEPVVSARQPDPVRETAGPKEFGLEMPDLVEEVQRLLDGIESAEVDGEPPKVAKASHLIAAVIRLLLRKEVFTDAELLEELKRR